MALYVVVLLAIGESLIERQDRVGGRTGYAERWRVGTDDGVARCAGPKGYAINLELAPHSIFGIADATC